MYNFIGAIVFKPLNYALWGNPLGKGWGRRRGLGGILDIVGGSFRAKLALGLLPQGIILDSCPQAYGTSRYKLSFGRAQILRIGTAVVQHA